MTKRRLLIVVTFAALMLLPNTWAISGEEYKFRGGPKDGAQPNGALVSDGAGNFYGTTSSGGLNPCSPQILYCGTVFKTTLGQDGSWTESVIYEFKGGSDGAYPSSSLIFDGSGNL